MTRYKHPCNILVISKHDLRAPFHGGARLLLSILGALSYHHNVVYMGFTGIYDNAKICTEFRNYLTSFYQVTLGYHYKNPFSIHKAASDTIRYTNFFPDIILCASREYIFACKLLARKYGAILLLLQDALRYLYINSFLKALAVSWYILVTVMSDVSICVTRDIENRLRKLSLGFKKNIYTIRPTFMLLADMGKNTNVNEFLDKLEGFDTIVHYSGPLELLPFLAVRFPCTLFTITGPSAYYAKQYVRDKECRNIVLLHNVPDSVLKALYDKLSASIIIRPVMTGISMTVLQSLYFGVPIIANKAAVLGLEDLVNKYNEKGIIKIFTRWGELAKTLRDLSNRNRDDLRLRETILRIFDENLSPRIFNAKFNAILSEMLSSRV
jgi:glycosyltransferase involved in cell wall biosynthesis